MYGGTLWVLCHGRARRDINFLWIAVSTAFFLLNTAHFVLFTHSGLQLVTFIPLPGPAPPIHHKIPPFSLIENETLAGTVIYHVQTLLGDAVVIYRCFVVWQSFWIILVPVIMWVVSIAAAVEALSLIGRVNKNGFVDIFSQGGWILAFYALSLATNVLSSGLLAYRIWAVDSKLSKMYARVSNRPTHPIIRIVVDAGVLYSLILVAALVTFLFKSDITFIVFEILPPVISIIFYMIILRVGAATGPLNTGGFSTGTSRSAWRQSGPLPGRSGFTRDTAPLEVHITKSIDNGKYGGDPYEGELREPHSTNAYGRQMSV